MSVEKGRCSRAHQPMESRIGPTGKPVTVAAGHVVCLLLLNRRSRAEFGAELMRQGHLTEPSMKCPFAANTAWAACPFRA